MPTARHSKINLKEILCQGGMTGLGSLGDALVDSCFYKFNTPGRRAPSLHHYHDDRAELRQVRDDRSEPGKRVGDLGEVSDPISRASLTFYYCS